MAATFNMAGGGGIAAEAKKSEWKNKKMRSWEYRRRNMQNDTSAWWVREAEERRLETLI